MYGPAIICRTLSIPSVSDRHGNRWQYYSRSDHHAKVAAWAILFDLLLQCPVLRKHAERGDVTLGLNREIHDFWTGEKKNVDFVLGVPDAGVADARTATLKALRRKYDIELSAEEADLLEYLPDVGGLPVRNIQLAVDVRTCMTGHAAAVPRLQRDLDAGHRTIHGAADSAIAVAFVMVNGAEEFVSPDRNKFSLADAPAVVSRHTQPDDAARVSTRVREVAHRDDLEDEGYDALGLVALAARNDGRPVKLLHDAAAPDGEDPIRYEGMLARMAGAYEARFAAVW